MLNHSPLSPSPSDRPAPALPAKPRSEPTDRPARLRLGPRLGETPGARKMAKSKKRDVGRVSDCGAPGGSGPSPNRRWLGGRGPNRRGWFSGGMIQNAQTGGAPAGEAAARRRPGPRRVADGGGGGRGGADGEMGVRGGVRTPERMGLALARLTRVAGSLPNSLPGPTGLRARGGGRMGRPHSAPSRARGGGSPRAPGRPAWVRASRLARDGRGRAREGRIWTESGADHGNTA